MEDTALEQPDVLYLCLKIGKLDKVVITGFVYYSIYIDLLQKVDVIMDLTTDDKSIITGAYEAVALEEPLITSNWILLRRTFNKITIYTNSSSDDIRKAIMVAVTKKEELSIECIILKRG